MAIFNKSDQSADHASNVSTIAAGSHFEGTIEIKCALHIDGECNGSVRSDNVVSVGKDGVLKSDLHARKLVVAGHFHGTAECDAVEIVSGGVVEGTLFTSNLAIESGSIFQGESVCTTSPSGEANVVEFAAESEVGVKGAV